MGINIWKFVKYISVVALVTWALILYPLFKFGSDGFITSFAVGSLISLINSIVGFLVIKHGMAKSDREFFKLTIGSIGLRLFLIAGLILILLKFLNFEIYGLVISLLLFYFLFLAVEIVFFAKLKTKREF
ncbi:hypothetical protein JGI1_00251 [Candidatus Thermokryptus mobilis]|uniref:ATP synthase I chain n=1 Tax=Candidatus Thermokryptus mobilis TaxID=1643428 RepID=A0A0S4MQZ3_9BACT|nr:hypothetical protein [Candidatus Thermokryptus mobilis]CUU01440.1 hypothetical protein JGI1_00251 [Candidatus Thermokryptus mobilis]